MIDYLEQLLNQDVDEEETPTFAWPRVRIVSAAGEGNGGREPAQEMPAEGRDAWMEKLGERHISMTEGAAQITEPAESVEEWAAVMEDWQENQKSLRAKRTPELRMELADSAEEVHAHPEQKRAETTRDVLMRLAHQGGRSAQKRHPEVRAAGKAAFTQEVVGLEQRLVELSRAVVRGKRESVAAVWKQNMVSGTSAENRPDAGRMGDSRLKVRRGLATMLDATFERDARRYDGPLGLF